MPQLYFKVDSDVDRVIQLREEITKLKTVLSGMDGNTSPATFRAMEVQLSKNTKELDNLIVTAARAGNEIDHNFKKKIFDSSMAVNNFTEEIIKQKAIIRETQEDVRVLADKYAKLGKNNPMSASSLSELNKAKSALSEQRYALGELQTQQANTRLSVKKLKDEYALFNKESNSVVSANNGMSISFAKVFGVIGGAAALKSFSSQMVEVRAEMQSLNKSFEVLLGSKAKSDAYVKEIKDYALVSPLSVTDVSKAAQTLLGFNVEAEKTMPIIKSIGDITMGNSQKFSSLILAFSQMSSAGRLMGQDLSQMISAGFNPLQVISEKTGKSFVQLKKDMESGAISSQMVADAFASATAEGGKFHGMIEKSADGIRNAQNRLTGAIEETLNAIGESQEGIIMGSYEVATSLVQNYDKVGRVIVGLIATYGTYRTAVILATASENGHSIAMLLTRDRIMLVRRAQQLLNATMLANPYLAVTTLVVGLAAAMWALSESTTAVEQAQKKFSERMQNIENDNKNRKVQVDKLISVIQDETAAETDRFKAIQELRKIVPEVTKNMSDEAIKTGELTEQKKKYNEELSKQIGLEKQRELNQLYAKKKNLESSIKTDRGTKGYKYQYRADQDQLILNEVDKQIAKLEKEKADFFKLKEQSNQGTKLSSISDEIKATTEKISTLKQKLANLRNGKSHVEAGKTVQSAIEEKTKELKAAEDALSILTGRDKSSEKKAEDEQKKQLEKQKAIFAQLLELRMQNQEDEINQMKDGSEKKIAQINLDYDKEIAAIMAKEKEWKEAQGGKLTAEQTVVVHTAYTNAWVKREQSTGVVNREQLAEEKRMMNEYLQEYGTYFEKRQSIIELYNEKIAKVTTKGEKLSLGEEMKRELATVDDEVQKKTSIITRLFNDMSHKSVTDMRLIADEAERFLSFLESGEYSSDNSFGITKEQFDTLRKLPDQLKSIKDEIVNVRREADQCETSFNKISGGLKKIFSAGNDNKKLKEGLAEVEEGMNNVMQAGQFLSDSLSELSDAFGNDTLSGIAEGVNVAMDAMSSAMDGAKAGAAFGPWGAAAGAAIGMVTSLASSFAKIHDAKNEKRIQVLQEQIDVLDKSYEKLGESIEKAYSKDASSLISQQNKMLEQQKVLIQQQIREEEDKKKTDNDRIKEWREQIEEINKTIADNKEKAVDAIFGEDLKSAIENFASAYAEAWASGEDRAKSAKDTVKNMMRQMVTESIKAAMESSKSMEKIRGKLKEFYSDNVLSGWEQDYIYNMAEELQKELDRQFGWADGLMKDDTNIKDGVSGQLQAAMTEGTASQLVGLWNSTAIDMRELKQLGMEQRDSVRTIMSDVTEILKQNMLIEQNTRRGADNTDGLIGELQDGFKILDKRLENIEKNTKTSYSRG